MRNKPRLALALYARPKHPNSYHWALLIVPKNLTSQPTKEAITKHHVKNTILPQLQDQTQADVPGRIDPWRYETLTIPNINTELNLLAVVIIAKITVPVQEVTKLLEEVKVYQIDDPDTDQARQFSCRKWLIIALQSLKDAQTVTGLQGKEWDDLERQATGYVERKKGEGRWSGTFKGQYTVPILDIMTTKEIVP